MWFVPLSCLLAYNKLMSLAYFFLEPTPMSDVPAQNTLGSAAVLDFRAGSGGGLADTSQPCFMLADKGL